MINASMQQPLCFMFSFPAIIQLEHIDKSNPAWPQRIMGHSTCLCPSALIIIRETMATESLRVLLTAEDASDSDFTPTTKPVCGGVSPTPQASLLSVMTVFQTFVTSSVCEKIFAHLISSKHNEALGGHTIEQKCSVLSCKHKKIFFSLCFEHCGKR